jgi:predicted Zn-dependent peptidase
VRRAVLAIALAVAGCAGGGLMPQPPELRGAPKMWMPTFTSRTLPNGIVLQMNRDPYLPMASVAIGLRGGAAGDPADKAGLTFLLVRSLVARTERLDRLHLSALFDVVGGVPSTRTLSDGVVLQLDVLEDRLQGALKLLAEVLQKPGFTDDELARLKDEQQRLFVERIADPDDAAMAGMRQVLYGRGHPLGRPAEGTRSSLAGITTADLRARYEQVVHPRNLALVVSGRFEEAELVQVVNELYGSWAPQPPPVVRTPPPPVLAAGSKREHVYYVPRPGLAQTVIVVGTPALPEQHPDRYLLRILARRVPGSASGWLRGVQQVTYGVGYVEDVSAAAGWVGAQMAVDAAHTGSALKSLVNRYDAMVGGNFDVEKVAVLTGEGLPYYSIVGRTVTLASLHARGLPFDHWVRLRATLDDERDHRLQDLMMQHLDGDRMQVVLVGDPGVIAAQVPGQGLGDLQLLTLPN